MVYRKGVGLVGDLLPEDVVDLGGVAQEEVGGALEEEVDEGSEVVEDKALTVHVFHFYSCILHVTNCTNSTLTHIWLMSM